MQPFASASPRMNRHMGVDRTTRSFCTVRNAVVSRAPPAMSEVYCRDSSGVRRDMRFSRCRAHTVPSESNCRGLVRLDNSMTAPTGTPMMSQKVASSHTPYTLQFMHMGVLHTLTSWHPRASQGIPGHRFKQTGVYGMNLANL